jgi:hypothetical protein
MCGWNVPATLAVGVAGMGREVELRISSALRRGQECFRCGGCRDDDSGIDLPVQERWVRVPTCKSCVYAALGKVRHVITGTKWYTLGRKKMREKYYLALWAEVLTWGAGRVMN